MADAGTRRRAHTMMFGMVAAVISMWAVTTWAQPAPAGAPPAPPMGHDGGPMGPGMHRGGMEGMGGDGMMMGGSPRHMAHKIDGMLDGLGATDAQRAQIKQIVFAAGADLKAQRESGRSLRDRGMQIFTAPTVDPAAAESLRQQMLAQHEQASKRMMQAMLDVSRVLTPEQRAKLGARMTERADRMHDRMERLKKEHPPR